MDAEVKIQTKFINKLAHHSLLAEQHVPLRISNAFDVILVLCAPPNQQIHGKTR
jgi:hypothetical protein